MRVILPYLFALGVMSPPTYQQSTDTDSTGETTGPFSTVYQWNLLDFEYPSEAERSEAISSEAFIKENNLPLGIDVWKDRIFVSMPRWKSGVPATLAWLPRKPENPSPQLRPYPSWDWHTSGKIIYILAQ